LLTDVNKNTSADDILLCQITATRPIAFYYSVLVQHTLQALISIRRWDSERELLLLHEFAEITQNNGDYTVQGHSRSPILVPIEISYTISY